MRANSIYYFKRLPSKINSLIYKAANPCHCLIYIFCICLFGHCQVRVCPAESHCKAHLQPVLYFID